MQIPVLIEPVAGNGYRAEPLTLRGEGATQEEALAKLQEQLQRRLGQGATLVSLHIPAQEHPLAKVAGLFKDDPDFQEVKEIIAENRRQMDADADIP
jgi:hypothetical protein